MILDRFGNKIQASNYSSTHRRLNNSWVRPRYVDSTSGQTFKCLNSGEKAVYNSLARDLFRSSPSIRSAITRKNSWACAQGWQPIFKGTDSEYGKVITDYLVNVVYPNCNTAGGNYSFNRSLLAISNEIDVGGDCLVVFVTGRDNQLKMQIYPSSVVGQRNSTESVVSKGRYKGNSIYDGIVYDTSYSPIAYAMMEEDRADDYYLSARNGMLLFEPEEGMLFRGVSVIAASLLTALNGNDIEEYLSRTVKLQSKMGILFKTKSGDGSEYRDDNYVVGSEDDSKTLQEKVQPTISDMGDYIFFNAENNEGAESFEPKQPGENVQEFLRGLEEKCLYNIGWHLALISPNTVGSYAARIMESQVQQLIATRQQTLKRIAKTYCIIAIAKAIENGDLPAPKAGTSDWRSLDFHMPANFVIDSYYQDQMAIQQWTTGNESLSGITARKGIDWTVLRNQREMEAQDALVRAKRLSNEFGVSLERALDLITKQIVSAAPVQQVIQPT